MFENVSRRHFLQGSAAVAMGLGLAGCGNDGGDSASGDGGSTIKVGILGPHTGDVANYGIACRNGAQLYFDQLNADGGINGKQVEYLVEDEQGDPTQAVTAYNLLVEQGVVGIVGDVTTGPTTAVAQQSVNDNMPCVTPSATAAEIVTYGDNTFRACVTDPEQGRIMAAFANEQGYKNVGTLYLKGDDYNEGVNNAFVEEAQALGITITTEQSYSAGDVDFNSQLPQLLRGRRPHRHPGPPAGLRRRDPGRRRLVGRRRLRLRRGPAELLLLLRVLLGQHRGSCGAIHGRLRGGLRRDADQLLRARL